MPTIKLKLCRFCQGEIPRTSNYAKAQYCGTACQYKGISFNRTKPMVCRYCSVEFRVAKSSTQTICSNACRYTEQADPNSEANRSRKLIAKGELSHRWKGGVSKEYQIIRMSAAYRQWRTAVFRRDWFTCQLCGAKGGIIQADHIKPFCNYPDLRFDINNGQTLCVPCHKQTATYGYRAHYA